MVIDHDHLLLHFSRNGAFGPDGGELVVLDRGEGPYVFDPASNRYIDGISGLFCVQIGYSYGEEMGAAAAAQLRRLAFNTLWSTAHPPAIELSDALAALAPEGLEKVFFTCGGSEAVEAAWKLARQFHLANGEPARNKAIARRTAYHGVSLAALSFTGVVPFKEAFGRDAVTTCHVDNTNSFRSEETEAELCRRLLMEIEEVIVAEGPETVAMIIAEPVQNSGGCLLPPTGYWQGLREIADRHGILLVADEVITGMGRLGEYFGVTRYGVVPDLVTIAKGLTSAYAPMGAVLVSERVAAPFYEPRRPLLHGLTFGGHPLSAAIALKNLEIFERDGVLENVRANEAYFQAAAEQLRTLPIVGDVRGAGYFWAFELVKDEGNARFNAEERERLLREYLPARLLEAGVIARPDDRGDSVLQIGPPLISDRALLDELIGSLGEVLSGAGEFVEREFAVAR